MRAQLITLALIAYTVLGTALSSQSKTPSDEKMVIVPGGKLNDMAYGLDKIWVTTGYNKVIGIDPKTGSILKTISLHEGSSSNIKIGFGSIWVKHEALTFHDLLSLKPHREDEDLLLRIDPVSTEIVAKIPVKIGPSSNSMTINQEGVWICYSDTLSKIDPHGNKVVRSISTGKTDLLTTGDGSIWSVMGHSPENDVVDRIEPDSWKISASIPVGEYCTSVAFGEGSVWVVNAQPGSGKPGTVSRIDPHTNNVIATIEVGDYPLHVTVGGGSVWVSNLGDNTITRIDPHRNVVSATLAFDYTPRILVYAEGSLWVMSDRMVTALDPEKYLAIKEKRIGEVKELEDSSQWTGKRPILHATKIDEEEIALSATYPDGRRDKVYRNCFSGTWSPKGDVFSCFEASAIARAYVPRIIHATGGNTAIDLYRQNEIWVPWQAPWSPDGSLISLISISGDSTRRINRRYLNIIDVTTGKVQSQIEIPKIIMAGSAYPIAPNNEFRWSPDGRRVLISSGGAIIVDMDKRSTEIISDKFIVAEWNSRGDGIYYFEPDRFDNGVLGGFFIKHIGASKPKKLLDVEKVEKLGLVLIPFLGSGLMTLSPDATKMAIVGGRIDGSGCLLNIYDLSANEEIVLEKPSKSFQVGNILALDWSPDAKHIAVAINEYKSEQILFKVLNLDNGLWRTFATLQVKSMDEVEGIVLGLKLISWTN